MADREWLTVADWQLIIAAQQHKKVSYHISPAKIKMQSKVPTECISLSYHHKVKQS